MLTQSATREAPSGRRRRDPERGAALIVALVALVALLGIGAVTMLAVQSDTSAAGHDRFQSVALYAAESGAAAGIEFLRANCDTNDLYTAYVTANNANPQSPAEIYGNGAKPGETGNPFSGTGSGNTWYEVTILNNTQDPKLADGIDSDGIVTLRVVGHGPSETQVTLEMDLQSNDCIASFCATDFAQENMNAMNSGVALACSSGALSNTSRTVNLE